MVSCRKRMIEFVVLTTVMATMGVFTVCEAATITTNIERNLVCSGEKLILICTSMGTTQRWNVRREGVNLAEKVFTSGDHLGTPTTSDSVYEFTLRSTQYYRFESTISTVVTNAINNTEVVCTGHSTPDTATIRIADEPSPPQNLRSRIVEHHSNYSTVVVMWEPASNDSRVDFYQYQLIDSLTDMKASNTTNTTAILSDVPYNVHISFVISSYNCERESEQATLLINNNVIVNTTTVFDQVMAYTFSSTTPEVSTNAVITPATEKENKLLISTTAACTVIIFVLILVCVIVAVVFVKQLRRKRLDLPQDLYTEIENVNPIYESIDNKALSCAEYNDEDVDMSYVDMCGGCAPVPVYDEAKIDLEAAEETPVTVDEKHKETKCCDLANNGIHYQNVRSAAQYSHYSNSNVPCHQQPVCSTHSIYDD